MNFPGATSTQVTGINAAGDLSGLYVDAAGNTHGFTRIGGSFTTVDNPASTVFNQALGINNSDETVGYYAPTQAGTDQATSLTRKKAACSPTSTICCPPTSTVRRSASTAHATPWIVGFYQPTGPTTSVGFVDAGGTITPIDPFGSTFTQALGVNDQGDIVGVYVDSTTALSTAILTTAASSPVSTRQGSASTTINGINDKGDIVGFYTTERHRRRVRRNARAGAFDLGDDAGRLRGAWFPWLSQGAPGKASGLRATLMVAVGRATATHLFSRPSCRNEGFP